MDSTLSVEVEHDDLPDWNRMLALPEVGDGDDVDKRLARASRLRVWRSGPAEPNELRLAVEAEVAEAVEHGELSAAEAADRIERVVAILASDTSIADPPDVDEVWYVLESSLREFTSVYMVADNPKRIGALCPVPRDRYGNWPGDRWPEAVNWALGRISHGRTASHRIAFHILRDEVTREAEAVYTREEAERRERSDQAASSLPAVFEGDQQGLLSLLRRFSAGGDIKVPTDGNPITEAALLRQVRNHDFYGLSPDQQSDVAAELIRVVAMTEAEADGPQIVPGIGYAIVVEHETIVDVLPGNLTLTIEGREHVLNSPELPRPVRMSAKMFRSARLCADAIYEQALVEVDIPRGHWRKWWPVLAARLGKLARRVEVGQRVEAWKQFVAGIMATAPESPWALPDGRPYRTGNGGFYVGKSWMIEQAVAAGVIGLADRKAFSDWLGTADKNRRDAEGVQHKVLTIGKNGSLCIEGSCEPSEKNEVDGSNDANEP
jgi:hypothetical protein